MTTPYISADEAVAALNAAAFTLEPDPAKATCGHPGCTDHPGEGEKIVHCRGSFTGADWSLDSVVATVRGARQIVWVDGPIGHDLGVEDSEGRFWYFNVKGPAKGATR